MFYLIKQLFFTECLPEYHVKKLVEKVTELEDSVAIGLADGYYFNFVMRIADILEDYDDEGKLAECTYDADNTTMEAKLCTTKLFIYIPRSLNMMNEDANHNELAMTAKRLTQKKLALDGKLKAKSAQARPM